MLIRIIDLETSGIPSETDKHAIIEIGHCDLYRESGAWEVGLPRSMLVNPGRPIPAEASAIHHITDKMVAGAPSPDAALLKLMEGAPDYFAAHRIDFERQFFGGGTVPWICSHKCSLRVWTDAPGHSNQTLRYHLGLDEHEDFERALAMPPHRAGPDAYVTAHLLRELIGQAPIESMARWSSGPALLIRVGFGKHFGTLWKDVPADYLDWIVHKSDMTDRDVRATAKYWLRGGPAAREAGNAY